jgi:RHS repeat-associated protein
MSDTAVSQGCKGLSWTNDAWGNRSDQTVTAGTCNTFHQAMDANNRLLGSPYQYDAAGNMTHDASHSYTYDAENHLTQVDAGATASYIYDPSGNRVRKNSGGSWTEYFYDTAGSVTAEHNSAGWPVEYVYVGGQLVAQYRDSTTYSTFRDHLGSTRLITKLDKSVYDSLDFLPFGEQIIGDTGTTHKFTGKERDSESGLDNFGARFDSSAIGRFMTPDWSSTPAAVPFADPANPQSLNLYSYVVNNPLNRTDPLGHNWFCTVGGSNCSHWEWHKGSEYTDKDGNKFTSKYTGLLVVQATGTDKKTGATTYALTLYDQNKAVATGNGFSGGNGMAPIKDGNYMIRLDIRDPKGPNTINPNSALNNPPPFFGIQKMHDITDSQGTWQVVGAYGPIRARLNPTNGKDDGDYFHGQSNGHGYTHGCLCYGMDTSFVDYMWKNMPQAPLPVAIDVPTDKP